MQRTYYQNTEMELSDVGRSIRYTEMIHYPYTFAEEQ